MASRTGRGIADARSLGPIVNFPVENGPAQSFSEPSLMDGIARDHLPATYRKWAKCENCSRFAASSRTSNDHFHNRLLAAAGLGLVPSSGRKFTSPTTYQRRAWLSFFLCRYRTRRLRFRTRRLFSESIAFEHESHTAIPGARSPSFITSAMNAIDHVAGDPHGQTTMVTK